MATYALNRIIRTTVNWHLPDGSLAQNVFHYGLDSAITSDLPCQDCNDQTQKLFNTVWITNNILHFLHTSVGLDTIVSRTIDPANPHERTSTYTLAGATGGSPPVPLESAVVTTLYTDLSSRRGRGRTFLPGLASGHTDGGVLYGPDRTTIEAQYILWLEDTSSAVDGLPVVWSPTSSAGHSLTGATTRSRLHHQRRRNR